MKIIIALGLLAVVIGIVICLRQLRVAQPPPIVVTSQGPTIQRLERLSQLVTSKVAIADVLIGVSDDSKAAFVIRGDALIGLDLNKAVITEKDDAQKQATIRLPQPRVILARVDHEKSKVYEFRTTSWIPWHAQPGRLLEDAMLQAQRMVAQAANSPENIEQARRQAEVIIAALYEHLGWSLKIVWQGPSTAHVVSNTTRTAETCQP
jgi:hypothetical protein